MKILVILNDLDIGGAQNYTVALMNQFVELGHDVSLIVLSDNLSLKSRLSADVKLWVWERKFTINLIVLNKLRREVGNGNYDGVISSYILYQKMATLCMSHTPITLYPIHSTVDRDLKSYIINFLMFRLKSRHEKYITSIDSQTHYLCKKYLLRSGFFDQIYNGIDTLRFSVVPDQFSRNEFLETIGVPVNHRIILMVAGFREEKRHIVAISSFKYLREVVKNVTLICVGDNRSHERNQLQDYINKNSIDGVKLLTASEAGNVKNYFWSADIFTLTSNKVETFPISVIEAMASGLPCVLTDTGGTKDIIVNKRLGTIVPVENVNAISKAWENVLKEHNLYEKDFIKSYAKAHFQIKSSADQYLNLFNKVKC
jgi:glycosyltransferase involved in cell wall biosynthesis